MTNLKNYGTEYPQQNEIIKEKKYTLLILKNMGQKYIGVQMILRKSLKKLAWKNMEQNIVFNQKIIKKNQKKL